MTYNYLRSRVALIGRRAGVPRMHPHAARHWFATSLLKAGTDIGRMVRPISSELFRKSTEPGEVPIPLGMVMDSDGGYR